MKSPLRKLRNFTFHKHDAKDKEHYRASNLDELVGAQKDMQDMKDCYESIVSAAASTANNAYEFSETLKELGTCFLEKTAMSNGEYGGRELMMLGKLQFQLQKLFNSYRAHIFQTLVKPSKSLLEDFEILEEMKIQCDTKRQLYEGMMFAQKEQRKSRNAKGEAASSKELKETKADYEDATRLFIFRLKSLKQSQFRSLLTQAARHHAAQLSFFRKGLKALEAVEPHVKAIADQQHIEYNFNGLKDESDDNVDDYDGELSFDYILNPEDQDVINISRSFEEETTDRSQSLYSFNLLKMPSSQSAPLSADRKSDMSEKMKEVQSSSTKFHSYALPTPTGDINPNSANIIDLETKALLRHSSPLDEKFSTKSLKESQQSSTTKSPPSYSSKGIHCGPIPINAYSGYSEVLQLPQMNPSANNDTKNYNRANNYETPSKVPVVSMATSHISKNHPSVSPPKNRSPPLVSSPKRELHELPRPPVSPEKVVSSSSLIGYSGPLISRNQVLVAKSKIPLDVSSKMSPLPAPPGPMKRSFSIPTRGQKVTVVPVAKPVEACGYSDSTDKVVLPALTPTSSATLYPVSPNKQSQIIKL